MHKKLEDSTYSLQQHKLVKKDPITNKPNSLNDERNPHVVVQLTNLKIAIINSLQRQLEGSTTKIHKHKSKINNLIVRTILNIINKKDVK